MVSCFTSSFDYSYPKKENTAECNSVNVVVLLPVGSNIGIERTY